MKNTARAILLAVRNARFCIQDLALDNRIEVLRDARNSAKEAEDLILKFYDECAVADDPESVDAQNALLEAYRRGLADARDNILGKGRRAAYDLRSLKKGEAMEVPMADLEKIRSLAYQHKHRLRRFYEIEKGPVFATVRCVVPGVGG